MQHNIQNNYYLLVAVIAKGKPSSIIFSLILECISFHVLLTLKRGCSQHRSVYTCRFNGL